MADVAERGKKMGQYGKSVKITEWNYKKYPGKGPNKSKADTYDMSVGAVSISAGDEPAKTSGIKIRGTGCATKGLMARGPMA
jgi:hypothetical protein